MRCSTRIFYWGGVVREESSKIFVATLRQTLKMVHKVFTTLCFVGLTTCQVWIYFQTREDKETFLKAQVPNRTKDTLVAQILINSKEILCSLVLTHLICNISLEYYQHSHEEIPQQEYLFHWFQWMTKRFTRFVQNRQT